MATLSFLIRGLIQVADDPPGSARAHPGIGHSRQVGAAAVGELQHDVD
jgi:hypothetical protein